ncbi:MAG: clostripain-related cysteine peptidase [Candidatus Babeliales bacterium]|nr:clostripain-related cysteine peptidase [Candidatus Babeliales bacterium]
MKKIIIIILLLVPHLNCVLPQKPWTAFFYLAGHNDLWGHLENAGLNSLPSGKNKNVNIISSASLFTGCKQPAPDHCTPTTQKFIATQKKNIQHGPTQKHLNTGLQTTLINQLTFAIKQAPSNFLAIFLAGHGQGPTAGICLDQQGNSLTDVNVQNALKHAIILRKKKTDILVIDCCIMACIEYYFAWADYTHFIVGSQEIDPGEGIPYNTSLNILKKTVNSKQFAMHIVNAFKQKYVNDQNQQQFTLSAVDSTKIKAIAFNIDQVAKTLLSLLKTHKKITFSILKNSINNVTRFPGIIPGGQIDLKDFYVNILNRTPKNPIFNNLKNKLKHGIALINQAVIRNGTKIPKAAGLNIFFPRKFCCQHSYLNTLFVKTYPSWVKLIHAFFAS